MDADIWTYADIQNGRRIILGLFAAILLKELAVAALPFFGLPVIDPIWAPLAAQGTPEAGRGPLVLALKILLVPCLLLGWSWARWALAITYLTTSLAALFPPLLSLSAGRDLGAMLSLANGAAGLVIVWILMSSFSVKAYLSWRATSARVTVPIPQEDEPVFRPSTRERTLGETLGLVISRMVSLVILAAILGLIAYLYGLTGPLGAILAR